MRRSKAGKVNDFLWYLGCEEAGVYILEGRESSIMINGGMFHILPDVLEQMKEFSIDVRKIRKILILHSHFDHLGIIPYFKRTWPKIDVMASARTWEILSMRKSIVAINAFNYFVKNRIGNGGSLKGYDVFWRNDITGMAVSEEDYIDLGGLTVQILATPGHSSCSISAYEPSIGALFASDAGGIPFENTSIPLGNSNFNQYQASLEKLSHLPVSYLCADHYGYITGEEARHFIALTIEEAKKFRCAIERALKQFGNVNQAYRFLREEIYWVDPDNFVFPVITEAILINILNQFAK